jgi:hypothetical protein
MTGGLAEFEYAYTHGPLDTLSELTGGYATGNCRRAVQDFMYKRHGRFFAPEDIYIPQSYHSLGTFVISETSPFSLEPLREGDVVYARKLLSKSGRLLIADREQYDSNDEWLFSLHNAVYLGVLTDETKKLLPKSATYTEGVPYVWHATVVVGGTVLWDWDTFARYYVPVSAKRFI